MSQPERAWTKPDRGAFYGHWEGYFPCDWLVNVGHHNYVMVYTRSWRNRWRKRLWWVCTSCQQTHSIPEDAPNDR